MSVIERNSRISELETESGSVSSVNYTKRAFFPHCYGFIFNDFINMFFKMLKIFKWVLLSK